ncbi:MAG: hypothetical protein U5O39_20495 [Gammaproteobacteria bacterium]|nr:hypothetical protein [Gammaproteobacteria bacterium]
MPFNDRCQFVEDFVDLLLGEVSILRDFGNDFALGVLVLDRWRFLFRRRFFLAGAFFAEVFFSPFLRPFGNPYAA